MTFPAQSAKLIEVALSIDQFLSRPMPKDKWIIDQLLPVGGALYFYGMPKTGKSLFALGMGLAVSDGHSKFLDFPVHVHGKVLYIQIDMPPSLWHTYVERSYQRDNPMSNMFFIDRLELPERTLNLHNEQHVKYLKKEIELIQPIVIVFDTLRSMHKLDEDNNTMMSNVYESILNITNGTAFVIVHHARKPGLYEDLIADARGATSISGRVDVIAKLSGRNSKERKLTYTTRDKELHPDGLELYQNNETGLYEVKMDSEQLLRNFLLGSPEATPKEITDFLMKNGVSKSQAYKVQKKVKGDS